MKFMLMTASAVAMIATSATVAAARDQILIVGSSTVFPYTQAVAEEFANQGGVSPVVESTGTGGGFQIFCAGVGADHPDITGASRAMKKSEYDLCAQNGVTDITEALIGYDGLALAISQANETDWDLSLEQIYLAFAAKVPVDGALVARLHALEVRSDLAVDVRHRLQNALAHPGVATVAKLDRLPLARGGTRRDRRGTTRTAREDHVDLDRGIAARVEDLPAVDRGDDAHRAPSRGGRASRAFAAR